MLAPWGSNHTNGSGEKVVDTMMRLSLQAATSYYQHKKYWTWHGHRLGRHHQLDHLRTDRRLGERIYDAKRLIGGAQSDHLPIKLRLQFGHKHSPKKPSRVKNLKVDWQKILEDQTTAGLFNRQATDNLHALKAANDIITSKALSKSIVKAAALVAPPDEKKKTGWFAENKDELLGLTGIMNKASEQMRESKTLEAIMTFREVRKNLRKCKRRAQREWSESEGRKLKEFKRSYTRRFWTQKDTLQA